MSCKYQLTSVFKYEIKNVKKDPYSGSIVY